MGYMARDTVYLIRKKEEYGGKPYNMEYYKYRHAAESIVADYNLSDAERVGKKLRKLGWLMPNSSDRPEAMGIIKRMSEGAWEVIEKHVNADYT